MINGNISFFLNSCVPPCNSDSEKNTTDPHNKMGLGEKRQVSSKKIKKREKAKKKRRYMKSSCQWTTIHFHFEVLRTVVKCDCIWQLPSLPVYHDGYTLPPWWCCSTCTLLCTHTQVHGYRDAQKWVYQTWTWTQTETTHMT